MERGVTFCLVIFVVVSVFSSPCGADFRSDYQYDKRSRAYYKLHIDGAHLYGAKQICAAESASLMVPRDKVDISVVHGMLKKYPDIGYYVWVGDDGQKHESAEEEPLIDLTDPEEDRTTVSRSCEVISRSGEIESFPYCWRALPFVCKMEEKDVFHDDTCGVNVKGYKFIETTGSCYKVPDLALPWGGAYDECQNEGAHLLVVNSEAESAEIKEFLKTAPKVRTAEADYFYFAGFRANKPSREFITIFNQTLDEAGFNRWSTGEPNNHQDSEYCGTVFRNDGLFNDVNCSHLFAFICEKELHT